MWGRPLLLLALLVCGVAPPSPQGPRGGGALQGASAQITPAGNAFAVRSVRAGATHTRAHARKRASRTLSLAARCSRVRLARGLRFHLQCTQTASRHVGMSARAFLLTRAL
jgi:hypothetical protein